MFLLIRPRHLRSYRRSAAFTFHYVSTYTQWLLQPSVSGCTFTFHYVSTYTWFYVTDAEAGDEFTFHYVSTYTLHWHSGKTGRHWFTFHYVSTYTGRQVTDPVWIIRIYIPLCFYLYNQRVPGEPSDRGHLHSTMFLLIHIQVLEFFKRSLIYIPLCFYLYLYISCAPVGSSQFTFHYVSTYTLM